MKRVVKRKKSLSGVFSVFKSLRFWLFLLGVGFFSTMTFFYFARKSSSSVKWKSIDEINHFASKLDEFPKMDNDNIIKPDYTSYFQSLRLSFIQKMKRKLLGDGGAWSAADFKVLLLKMTQKQKERGFLKDVILKTSIKEGDRLLLVGNLQAAFHSLTRLVNEWIKLGYMGKDLKLAKKTDRIFFIGNAINRAPYSLETLSLVMRLIEENPENAFYLQGNHEDNNYWKDYTLKQELQAKFDSKGDQEIPLEKEINEFFSLLPIAWYGEVYPAGSKKFLRISHEGRDSEKLKESKFGSFLQSAATEKAFDIKQLTADTLGSGESGITLLGLVRSEKKRKTFQTMDGMRLLPPEEGVVAWTVMSCPTKVYQMGIKFFFDAFAVLECKGKPEEWQIVLHNQDVRLKNGFETRSQMFLTGEIIGADGKKTAAPVEKDEAPKEEKAKKAEEPEKKDDKKSSEASSEKKSTEGAIEAKKEESKVEKKEESKEKEIKKEEVKVEKPVEKKAEEGKKESAAGEKKPEVNSAEAPVKKVEEKKASEVKVEEKKEEKTVEKTGEKKSAGVEIEIEVEKKKESLQKNEGEQKVQQQATTLGTVLKLQDQLQPSNIGSTSVDLSGVTSQTSDSASSSN